MKNAVIKIAKFLEETLSEEQIFELTEHLSFKSMKSEESTLQMLRDQNESVEDRIIRSGIVGEWKTTLSHSMVRKFEEWEQENLSGTNYPFILDYSQ